MFVQNKDLVNRFKKLVQHKEQVGQAFFGGTLVKKQDGTLYEANKVKLQSFDVKGNLIESYEFSGEVAKNLANLMKLYIVKRSIGIHINLIVLDNNVDYLTVLGMVTEGEYHYALPLKNYSFNEQENRSN